MGCGSSAAADASKPAAAKPAAETKKAERKLTRLKQTVIESDEETSLASVGCDLHVLACYNGENWDAKNYKRLPEGVIEVTLQKLKAPAVLLLSIYDATLWRITLASGARSSLLRVYLSGHHKSRVEILTDDLFGRGAVPVWTASEPISSDYAEYRLGLIAQHCLERFRVVPTTIQSSHQFKQVRVDGVTSAPLHLLFPDSTGDTALELPLLPASFACGDVDSETIEAQRVNSGNSYSGFRLTRPMSRELSAVCKPIPRSSTAPRAAASADFAVPAGASLHAVSLFSALGLHEGESQRSDQYDNRPVDVEVTDTKAPVVLMLCSFGSVRWRVHLAAGVTLRKVLVIGWFVPSVELIADGVKAGKSPAMVPVVVRTLPTEQLLDRDKQPMSAQLQMKEQPLLYGCCEDDMKYFCGRVQQLTGTAPSTVQAAQYSDYFCVNGRNHSVPPGLLNFNAVSGALGDSKEGAAEVHCLGLNTFGSFSPSEGPAPRGSIDVRVALPSRASAVTLVLFACNAIEWNLLLGDYQPATKSDQDGKEVKASKQETKASAAESKAGSAYAVTGPTVSRIICIGWVPHTVRINGKRVFDQVINVTFEPSLPWVLGLLPVDDAELADFANKIELLTGSRPSSLCFHCDNVTGELRMDGDSIPRGCHLLPKPRAAKAGADDPDKKQLSAQQQPPQQIVLWPTYCYGSGLASGAEPPAHMAQLFRPSRLGVGAGSGSRAYGDVSTADLITASGSDLHVVIATHASKHMGNPRNYGNSWGHVQVKVTTKERPVTLLLMSPTGVQWDVSLANGAIVSRLILVGSSMREQSLSSTLSAGADVRSVLPFDTPLVYLGPNGRVWDITSGDTASQQGDSKSSGGSNDAKTAEAAGTEIRSKLNLHPFPDEKAIAAWRAYVYKLLGAEVKTVQQQTRVEWFVVDGKRDIEPYDEKKRYSRTPSPPARLRLDWRGGAPSGAVGAGSASGSAESTTGAAFELHAISVSTADDKVRFNHGRWSPLQPIDVHISSEAQPAEGSTLALALCSEYNILWRVSVEPGVKVSKIVVLQRGSRNQGQIASRAVFRVVGSAEEAMAQLDSSAPLVDEADDFDVEVEGADFPYVLRGHLPSSQEYTQFVETIALWLGKAPASIQTTRAQKSFVLPAPVAPMPAKKLD